MTEVRFYHLERQSLDDVLPSLVSKALEGGRKVLIKTKDEREAERLNEHLWVQNPSSFLPHGTRKDGYTERQPVFLTSDDENANKADVLILTQGTQSENMGDFSLCCEMLDGRDSDAVATARTRWKTYKDKGFEVTYWQQGDKGWEKKTA
jgi:DNA polymerase-3 subunit chi